MLRTQSEMEAIVVSQPRMGGVMNPDTQEVDSHLVYDAEIQYKRKPPAVRMIMCSSLDDVHLGEPVMISYHSGMRCYQHSRNVLVSNNVNTFGGFFFTDGTPA